MMPEAKDMSAFYEDIENSFDEVLQVEDALLRIPAPSWKEQKRAEWVLDYLKPYGDAYIDDADNVIFTRFDDGSDGAMLFCAHTDTVFPDLTPFKPRTEDGKLRCPAAGDDTMNLAEMLVLIKYLCIHDMKPQVPVIFAANSGEEGLGNLRGSKELVKHFGSRLKGFVSFDGSYDGLCTDAVGSYRYRITVKTPGGHSFGAFGSRNAIATLSELITELYKVEVPKEAKTTYNVGVIEGGTSVNTIAQEASMLYEYRSEAGSCLQYMQSCFEEKIAAVRALPDAEIAVNTVGVRPCRGDVPEDGQQALIDTVEKVFREFFPDKDFPCSAGSTDCNVPLSEGIPAVCYGLCRAHDCHTREEYVELDSILPGMRIGARLMEQFFA